MNAAQWHQEILVKPVEELIPSSDHIISSSKPINNSLGAGGGSGQKKAAGTVLRPPKEQPIPCPRCNSTNTKFCYYNNYSLTQPRYFCKGCRRYWTEGGSLRNIPVGGGSRKHKRSPSSAAAAAAQPGGDIAKKLFVHPSFQNPNTMIQHQPDQRAGHDLNLSFPNHHQDYRSMSDFVHHLPSTSSQTATVSATTTSHLSALELLTGMTSRGSVGVGVGGGYSNSFMPIISDPDSVYSSASFSNFMHDFKHPTLNFSLDNGLGIGPSSNGGGGGFGATSQNDQVSTTSGGGRVLVSTFDGMKNQADDHHQNQNQHQQQADQNRGHGVSTGYWTGMLGGGGGSDW